MTPLDPERTVNVRNSVSVRSPVLTAMHAKTLPGLPIFQSFCECYTRFLDGTILLDVQNVALPRRVSAMRTRHHFRVDNIKWIFNDFGEQSGDKTCSLTERSTDTPQQWKHKTLKRRHKVSIPNKEMKPKTRSKTLRFFVTSGCYYIGQLQQQYKLCECFVRKKKETMNNENHQFKQMRRVKSTHQSWICFCLQIVFSE